MLAPCAELMTGMRILLLPIWASFALRSSSDSTIRANAYNLTEVPSSQADELNRHSCI